MCVPASSAGSGKSHGENRMTLAVAPFVPPDWLVEAAYSTRKGSVAMQVGTWVALSLALFAVSGTRLGPPPVVLDLGLLEPTPVPTPAQAQKKRLITTLTLQNSPKGDTVVTFEATDVVEEEGGTFRTFASKQYSLAEAQEKPELKPLARQIVEQIRVLEGELLDYVEKAGAPKPRAPMTGGQRP